MTEVASPRSAPVAHAADRRGIRHVALVFGRQARLALADPGPSFVLPMMPAALMIVVFTSVFDPLALTDGFLGGPHAAVGWDAFLVPGAAVLVALLGAGYTSASLATDLRSGYVDRLRLVDVGAGSALIGRLAFEAVRLVPSTVAVLVLGAVVGAEAANGPLGVLVLVSLVALLGVAFSSVFHLVAIATEDPQTPFTLQPLGLPLSFLSTALVPVAIMPAWSEALARVNPVSAVVDAARHAMIGELWSPELGVAVLGLGAWIGVATAVSARVLRTKLERS